MRPTPFGRYLLLERINAGGMAEVFKASTGGVEGFEQIVAIKRILPSVAEDREFVGMFVDEAKLSSQLSHANLARTFDLGRIDDTYYIAMEYVPGRDLRAIFDRLRRRGERMSLSVAAWILARVCDGLDYAHRKKDVAGRPLHIVHRDVSPQNILVSVEGEVKLCDFGIAKAATHMTRTQAGILKGKFGYMSPEQVRGLALDGRSDIFSAGVVLWELCTGERLFRGANEAAVLLAVEAAQVPPPSRLDPRFPKELERIILKALARDPGQRYQEAAELSQDLSRWMLSASARPVSREQVAALALDDDAAPAAPPAAEMELDPDRTQPLPSFETRGLAGFRSLLLPRRLAFSAGLVLLAAGAAWLARPRSPPVPAPRPATARAQAAR